MDWLWVLCGYGRGTGGVGALLSAGWGNGNLCRVFRGGYSGIPLALRGPCTRMALPCRRHSRRGLPLGDPEPLGVLAEALLDHLCNRQAATLTPRVLANPVPIKAVVVVEVFVAADALVAVAGERECGLRFCLYCHAYLSRQ